MECARGDGNAAAKGRGPGGRLAGEKFMWSKKSNRRVRQKQGEAKKTLDPQDCRASDGSEEPRGLLVVTLAWAQRPLELAPEPGGPEYFPFVLLL